MYRLWCAGERALAGPGRITGGPAACRHRISCRKHGARGWVWSRVADSYSRTAQSGCAVHLVGTLAVSDSCLYAGNACSRA